MFAGLRCFSFTTWADKEGTKRELSCPLSVRAGLKTVYVWKQHFYFCSFYYLFVQLVDIKIGKLHDIHEASVY